MDFLQPLLCADEAKRADRHTIDSLGVPGQELMERAGTAVALEVEELLSLGGQNIPQVKVLVVCGPGNNGGDGWVVARRLWQAGVKTLVVSLCPINSLKKEAKIAALHFAAAMTNDSWALPNLSPCLIEADSASRISDLLQTHKPYVIVDAIFGIGLSKPLEGLFRDAVVDINKYRISHNTDCHVLSIDLPSGLPSDGNFLSDIHIRADSTLAIQHRKLSHLVGHQWLSCGRVSCADIGIVLPKPAAVSAVLALHQPTSTLHTPPHPSFHKGHYGHVGVLLGSIGLQGASILASYSALRAGSGLVSLLCDNGAKIKNMIPPEVMRQKIDSPQSQKCIEAYSSLVFGPGLKKDKLNLAKDLMHTALTRKLPIVADAGALGLLQEVCEQAPKKSAVIATPHPGEAGRLLHLSSSDIEDDRIAAIKRLLKYSANWNCDTTWVLKGSCPIVANQKYGIIVCEGGISSLSVGGSGDVLAGAIAALFAQTELPFNAALLAVTAHLQAGRNLLKTSLRGFLAHEIADEIKNVLFEHQSST